MAAENLFIQLFFSQISCEAAITIFKKKGVFHFGGQKFFFKFGSGLIALGLANKSNSLFKF